MANKNIDWQNIVQDFINYSKEINGKSYLVECGNLMTCEGGWSVINLKDTCTECELDIINDKISDIHKYINFSNKSVVTQTKSRFQFKKSDIVENNILTSNKKYFVFLNPNETYKETFNIIAFSLVKGVFTFTIQSNRIDNYVYLEPIWNENKKLWIYEMMKLPEKVGVYNLFSGKIHTNKISIDFN